MLPHRVCIDFSFWLTICMILGDSLTAIAYLFIPIMIGLAQADIRRLVFGNEREPWDRHLAYLMANDRPISTMFQAFIYSCGAGHLMKIVVLYSPKYWIQAGVDLWTGITSIATVALLIHIRRKLNELTTNS